MKSFPKLLTLVLALCILAIGWAGFLIADYWVEYEKGTKSYTEIQSLGLSASTAPPKPDSTEDAVLPDLTVDFDTLREINPDLVGWIYIPDTNINYPVVQRKNDNNYYLSHLFDGTPNSSGCIFLDTRSTLQDDHILIHGHNMANGSMFRDLNLFRSRDFLDAHPVFWLLTPEQTYKVQVLSGSIVGLDSPVWQLDFHSNSAKQSWLQSCHGAAYIWTPVQPTANDKILTLSTCSYEFDQARWIVQGIISD